MNRIKDLRTDKGLRQIDVANATGIDQKTLSNYETGKTNPDSYAIVKLAEFFGVTTDYLLGLTPFDAKQSGELKKLLDGIEQNVNSIRKLIPEE